MEYLTYEEEISLRVILRIFAEDNPNRELGAESRALLNKLENHRVIIEAGTSLCDRPEVK